MPLTDSLGLPTSIECADARDRLEVILADALRFRGNPVRALKGLLADHPDCVMARILLTAMLALATDRAVMPKVTQHLETLAGHTKTATERERAHIAVLGTWARGNWQAAVTGWARISADWPRDRVAVFFAHHGAFLLGRTSDLRDLIAWVLPSWTQDDPGYGLLLGMYAFGLEENGHYARAEEAGRRAVERDPSDSWAVHAVAHVLEMQNRSAEGADWLRGRTTDWAPDNYLAHHNWWHLALFHLNQGDAAGALALYDAGDMVSTPPAMVMEVTDGAALLWRLHAQGHDIGDRMDRLARWFAETDGAGHYAFNDVHAMMAAVATGDTALADHLITTLERQAIGRETNAMMSRLVGLPAARAIRAYGEGDDATAIDLMLQIRPLAHLFGGSHAQRDVLTQTAIAAAKRSGQTGALRALEAERQARDQTK